MTNRKMKVGETLSQRGLALRSSYHVSTIRRRGERFKVFVNGERVAWRETWERWRMHSGRAHGYRLVEVEA